jgi:hypothetical protein
MRMVSEVPVSVWRKNSPENHLGDPSENLPWLVKGLQGAMLSQ